MSGDATHAPQREICDTCARFDSIACFPEPVGRRIRDLQGELRHAELSRQAACAAALEAGMAQEDREDRLKAALRESWSMTQEAEDTLQRERAEPAALAAAEALEARYRAGVRAALRALHAVHASLPDGDVLPRQSADALALAVEGALVAVLEGES